MKFLIEVSSFIPHPSSFENGGCSSMAERLTVDQEVVGSSPISHPNSPFHAYEDPLAS
jgi:hypothetical protein